LNQRFKNAAIEQVEFTFGEGSIANRFIESYLRSRSHQILKYSTKKDKQNTMNVNKEACTCKNIKYKDIIDLVLSGVTNVNDVQDKLRYGTGCGKCVEFIEFLIGDVAAHPDNYK